MGLGRFGLVWLCLGGFEWFQVGSNQFGQVRMDLDMFRLFQMGSDGFKWVWVHLYYII